MEELAELQAMGCHAAILGKSIYTGASTSNRLWHCIRNKGVGRMITKRIIRAWM